MLQNLNSVETTSKSASESLSALFYSVDESAFATYKSNLLFNNTCAALTTAKVRLLGSARGSVVPSVSSLTPRKECADVQILGSGANIVVQFMLNFADACAIVCNTEINHRNPDLTDYWQI